MNPPSDESGRFFTAVSAAALAAVGALIFWDLIGDYLDGVRLLHLTIEGLALFIAATGAALLIYHLLKTRRKTRELLHNLIAVTADSSHWRQQYRALVRGLGKAIGEQFAVWSLSAAEAEVGMLLLKGLSLKEIAALRQASERTVRDQARAVYRKAGLGGRAELAAYFLEDLLPPAERPE